MVEEQENTKVVVDIDGNPTAHKINKSGKSVCGKVVYNGDNFDIASDTPVCSKCKRVDNEKSK